ncbi:MAG: 2-oxoacid:acceptor oxidoreductase family protein [Phycisphaerae bacterium]|nr:2-oxoacid:acceptor oxidoreductase family protein [Phycisphaerae bacterium]
MPEDITNVVIAGLGGQGVLKASGILSEAAFMAGLDTKKSEVHGMSQRGGSVNTDVRFGTEVLSPMILAGEADFLVVLTADQIDVNKHMLREGGVLISADQIDESDLANRRSLNVAMLGILSTYLDIGVDTWLNAVQANLAKTLHEANIEAFHLGRNVGRKEN